MPTSASQRHASILASVLATSVLTACLDTAPASQSVAVDAGVDCTLVPTPGGLRPRTCVHEVPSGAEIAIDDAGVTTVTVGDKVVAHYPVCPCAQDAGVGPRLTPRSDDASVAEADAGR